MAVKGQRTSYTIYGPEGIVEKGLKKSYADKRVARLNEDSPTGAGYYTAAVVTTGNLRGLGRVLEEAGARLR